MDLIEIINPDTLHEIRVNTVALLQQREAILSQIDQLEQVGCVWGNIVTEWRGDHGPYYRLTFYTDPQTGLKPKPRYLGSNLQRVALVEQQIDNYEKREVLRERMAELDRTLYRAKQELDALLFLTQNQLSPPQQLVMPVAGLVG